MLIDYHIHTKRCRHATGEAGEYLRQAERIGLSEIGFSDHCPYFRTFKKSVSLKNVAMPVAELPEYVEEITRLRKRSRIPIRLGMEVDFLPGDFKAFTLLKRYDFDYFIGSIHFIDEWGFDQEEFLIEFDKMGKRRAFIRYCDLLGKMGDSCLFDIVGHIDLPKKFGHYPDKGIFPHFEKALRHIKAGHMAVEVNTSGLDRKAQEMYPSQKILEMCYNLDIPITLGSDSHKPEEVGRHFDLAKKVLRKVGYTSIVRFEKHRFQKVKLG
jgi:histidinol-phosphatase (PHP family)